MALTAQNIVDRVKASLNDPGLDHWTETELLQYLSDGQRTCVLLRPDVNPVTEAFQLTADSVKQMLGNDCFQLLEVTRNLGASATSAGEAISPTSRSALDKADPGWSRAAPVPSEDGVENYVYDVRNRKVFWVSPPVTGTHYIETVCAKTPVEITALETPIGIDDIFEPALFAYVMHRARAKDIAVEGQGGTFATAWFQWFVTLLLGREDAQQADIVIRQEATEQAAS